MRRNPNATVPCTTLDTWLGIRPKGEPSHGPSVVVGCRVPPLEAPAHGIVNDPVDSVLRSAAQAGAAKVKVTTTFEIDFPAATTPAQPGRSIEPGTSNASGALPNTSSNASSAVVFVGRDHPSDSEDDEEEVQPSSSAAASSLAPMHPSASRMVVHPGSPSMTFTFRKEAASNAENESRAEARSRLTSEWKELSGNMGTYRELSRMPGFKVLKTQCAPFGLKPCSALTCRAPIKLLSEFNQNSDRKDGRHGACRDCSNDPAAMAAASRKRKLDVEAEVEAKAARFLASGVEDEAREWLLPLLRTLGLEARATLEFRLADLAARRSDWPTDAWIPIQLKSNGVFKKDGTMKPNDRSDPRDGGGRGEFRQCTGYGGMLVVFVKSRRTEGEGTERSVWVCDGGEIEKRDMSEHINGTLGPRRIQPIDGSGGDAGIAAGVAAAIDAANPAWRRSWESINLEVEQKEHQCEAAGMLALRCAGFTVDFGGGGNQTVIDCSLSGPERWMHIGRTQAKTMNIKTGMAYAAHFVKGVRHRPYGESDPLDALAELAIVESRGVYYILYAFQHRNALVYNGVFSHGGYRGKPRSPGKTCIYPELGIFQKWLTGKTRKKSRNEDNMWLRKPCYGLRVPVEITPAAAEAARLPWSWVEKHAKPVAAPDAFPSPAELEQLRQDIAQSDRSEALAADDDDEEEEIDYADYDTDDEEEVSHLE
jgi:hypothetical protein